MSRTRIVKGKYVKIINGNYNVSAEGNIFCNALNEVREKGEKDGVIYDCYEKIGSDVSDDFDMQFSIIKDDRHKTVVPLGILDFNGNNENAFFAFRFSLMLGNVDTLEFKIYDEDENCIYAMGYLPEVVVVARKYPSLLTNLDTKKPKFNPEKPVNMWNWKPVYDPFIVPPSDYTKIGSYTLLWDGFDNNGIYDSTLFNGKTLKAKVIGTKNGIEKFKEVKFATSYKEVDWVDVKIDKNNKRVDATLRVNLKDGGENGLSCTTRDFDPDPKSTLTSTVCDWDDIPASAIKPNQPIIKTRTRRFTDLEKLALSGIEKHWSRKKFNLTINNEVFQLETNPINTKNNSLNSLELIFNTNTNWGRSGNPGFFGKIYYNIGYCNFLDWYEPSFLNEWGYLDPIEHKIDEDFMYTSAHELGHSILKAYGSTWHSFTHDESSNIWQTPNGNESYLIQKQNGEINLMHYFKDDPYQPQYDYNLIVASENDVLGLIWLTKLKIN